MQIPTSFLSYLVEALALIVGLRINLRGSTTSWSSLLYRPAKVNHTMVEVRSHVLVGALIHSLVKSFCPAFLDKYFLSTLIKMITPLAYLYYKDPKGIQISVNTMISILNELVNDRKVEPVTPKRKKARKSKKPMVNDNAEDKTNMLQNEKTGELNGQLVTERKIGRLSVSNTELGKGSNGTIVWEGNFDDPCRVAVKHMSKEYRGYVSEEIQYLMKSDHPNIVRWYGDVEHKDSVYVVLELCICNLHELILRPADSRVQLQLTSGLLELSKVISDIVDGIAYMHKHEIIHGNLKPENILIQEKDGSIRAKISDIGISKRVHANMPSVSNATGTGWQAPEQLDRKPETLAADLFSLGCLLYFCITGGKHPFGDEHDRGINILNDDKDLFLIDDIPEDYDLINRLLHKEPNSRPTAAEVLNHPRFWDPLKRLSFLRDASDFIDSKGLKITPKLVQALENIVLVAPKERGKSAPACTWDQGLPPDFLKEMRLHRPYNINSICDLLRIIRNTSSHYLQLSKPVQAILGPPPLGYESYFRSMFPKLLMEVHKVLQVDCGQEEILQRYYRQGPL